jgi:hypothetical protein
MSWKAGRAHAEDAKGARVKSGGVEEQTAKDAKYAKGLGWGMIGREWK